MAMMDSDEIFFVYENRLASFQIPHPIEDEGPSTRAPKVLTWPHKTLSPVAFAKAGFFFEPYAKSPDNVVCFLCDKSLDGWEEHDNPLEEHLKHSPTCGWAIMAAIEADMGNYGKVHPLDPFIIEARKATFAGRWPYESKKGFKCKTKKLVEAGWKYTPSRDADDMATCAYCHLALEGWESDDNPWDEHFNRAPNCPFFTLISQQPAPKKSGKAKVARPSKAASRLSIQSIATIATAASDLTSAGDTTATYDDSIVTTASTMTQGAKKATKAKKAPAPKGRKTKAKKNEPIEVLEDEPEVQEPESGPAPPLKAPRGRKRASDSMEDSEVTNSEAPAPKKRATRAKSVAPAQDNEMVDAPANEPTKKKKARGSTAKSSRKVSQASTKSQASTASQAAESPDDDEIERQLEADLDRYDSEDEGMSADPETEKQRAQATVKERPEKSVAPRKASLQSQKEVTTSYAMFDPTPMEPNEDEVEAEFQALQAEMESEQPEAVAVPKKGRKAGTRKASKQTKKPKGSEPPTEPLAEPVDEDMDELSAPSADVQYPVLRMEEHSQPAPESAEAPDASTGTAATKTESQPVSLPKRGRGRPSKKSLELRASLESMQQEQQQQRQSITKEELPVDPQPQAPRTRGSLTRGSLNRGSLSSAKAASTAIEKPSSAPVPSKTPTPVAAPTPTPVPTPAPVQATPRRKDKSLPPPPPSSASQFSQPPTTPRRRRSSRSAEQAAISPSQSPQSSDAENQRPSNGSSSAVAPEQVALAPVVMTPQRSSPSKRNFVAGLQSSTPWRPADLDMMFTPAESKENGVTRLLYKAGELTSPEMQMTVEEWIYHNAGLAEQKLKLECEAMVSAFEGEGTRAMKVLEGLIVE